MVLLLLGRLFQYVFFFKPLDHLSRASDVDAMYAHA